MTTVMASRAFVVGLAWAVAWLALDVKSGWQQGGQSGTAVIPGQPDENLLIAAVRHTKPDYEMPPDGDRLPADEAARTTLIERAASHAIRQDVAHAIFMLPEFSHVE
jgi:hypothetical protein